MRDGFSGEEEPSVFLFELFFGDFGVIAGHGVHEVAAGRLVGRCGACRFHGAFHGVAGDVAERPKIKSSHCSLLSLSCYTVVQQCPVIIDDA